MSPEFPQNLAAPGAGRAVDGVAPGAWPSPGGNGRFENDLYEKRGRELKGCLSGTVSARWGRIWESSPGTTVST